MPDVPSIYRMPLGLLTDLYQLTMAYGYWKLGRAEQQAVFHLFFRKTPFQGGYALAAGLAPALDFVEAFRIDSSDADYLQSLKGNDGEPLFGGERLPECVFGHRPAVAVRSGYQHQHGANPRETRRHP